VSTRASLRSLIRQELGDAGGTPLWSDALLNQWIGEAIRRYGRELPRELSTTMVVVAGQASYSLPADCDRVVRVEQPKGSQRSSGDRSQAGYRTFAGQILLDPPPGATGSDQDLRLEYLGRYAEPAADADVIATPPGDDDLLMGLVCASALRWIDLDEAKRQRFERERGASAGETARWYRTRAEEAIALRKRRVRTSVLVPTSPPNPLP
jgi:hypothetical protein